MPSTALSPSRLQHRWRNADSESRRRLIVDTSLDLLQRQGLVAVTMRRVAQRLGVGAMTLYTYINNQESLHRKMTQRGFELLRNRCDQASTLGTPLKWRGESQAYLNFAMENPSLYKLMFDMPFAPTEEDSNTAKNELTLQSNLSPLVDKVIAEMANQGLRGEQLQRQAEVMAAPFWIALHGLASLLITGHTRILKCNLDHLLDDVLEKVAPS